jgi:hypothetical protein
MTDHAPVSVLQVVEGPARPPTFDELMKLAEFDRQRLVARSLLTWQMLIVIWAAQGAVIFQPDKLSWRIQLIFALAALAGGWFWIWHQWRRYERDGISVDTLIAMARKQFGMEYHTGKRPNKFHPVNWMQVGVTLSLTLGILSHAYPMMQASQTSQSRPGSSPPAATNLGGPSNPRSTPSSPAQG